MEPEIRDLFKHPLSAGELRQLLRGRQVANYFSWKSPTARAAGYTPGNLAAEQMIDLMAAEPRLLRRPLLMVSGELLAGFSPKEWQAKLKGRTEALPDRLLLNRSH